tara:strand:- start:116 stop:349 length:234 start_codon:yes stop_codon:yes gene_type:complete
MVVVTGVMMVLTEREAREQCVRASELAGQLLIEKLKLCAMIDCYLMGSETLEKIDNSARKLLDEVGYNESRGLEEGS